MARGASGRVKNTSMSGQAGAGTPLDQKRIRPLLSVDGLDTNEANGIQSQPAVDELCLQHNIVGCTAHFYGGIYSSSHTVESRPFVEPRQRCGFVKVKLIDCHGRLVPEFLSVWDFFSEYLGKLKPQYLVLPCLVRNRMRLLRSNDSGRCPDFLKCVRMKAKVMYPKSVHHLPFGQCEDFSRLRIHFVEHGVSTQTTVEHRLPDSIRSSKFRDVFWLRI